MSIKVDEAIRIAKIIEYAPADRLSLIVDVFNQADICIDSLECVAGCKADDLLDGIEAAFKAYKTDDVTYKIPAAEFTAYCSLRGLNSYQTRAELARSGILQVYKEGNKRTFTQNVRRNGKITRCVVLRVSAAEEEPETKDGHNPYLAQARAGI